MTAAATTTQEASLAAKRPFFCYFSLDEQRKVDIKYKNHHTLRNSYSTLPGDA